MIRHGQSAANVDTSVYNRIPDYRIPLTPLGLAQATAAGERILYRFRQEMRRPIDEGARHPEDAFRDGTPEPESETPRPDPR